MSHVCAFSPAPCRKVTTGGAVPVAQRAQRASVLEGEARRARRGGSARRSRRRRPARPGRRTRRWVRSPCHSAVSGGARRVRSVGWRHERTSPRAPVAVGSGRLQDARRVLEDRRRHRRRGRHRRPAQRARADPRLAAQRVRVLRARPRRARRRRPASPPTTIAQLPVWRESGVFSDRERAGLELAEAFTFIHEEGVTDEVYNRVGGVLSEQRVRRAQLDPRLDQRLQPRRDRGSLPRAAARRPGWGGSRRRFGRGLVNLPARSRRPRRRQLPRRRRPSAPAPPGPASGVLYRSGNLARLDDAGVAALGGSRHPPHHRPARRRRGRPRAEPHRGPRASRRSACRCSSARSRPSSRDDVPLDEMYRRLVEDSADGVVEVVRGIIADQPVLVHCTVGKDRTGVTVALALAAAGVDARGRGRGLRAHRGAASEVAQPARSSRRCGRMHPEAVHLEDLATRSPAPVMRELLAGLTRAVRITRRLSARARHGRRRARRAPARADPAGLTPPRGSDRMPRATLRVTKVRQPLVGV